MALKITLKPHEKMMLGGAVITNGNSTSHFVVENTVPILRHADIMTEQEATSPCRRIYLAVQLMYMDELRSAEIHPLYWDLVRQVVAAAPSTKDLILQVSQHIVEGQFYKALKAAKKLIVYEEELIRNAIKPN
jgi:flagellar protein FlbT